MADQDADPLGQVESAAEPLLRFEIGPDYSIVLAMAGGLWMVLLAVGAVLTLAYFIKKRLLLHTIQLDSTVIGIGNVKATFKPNTTDRQIAYAIWVELATRKIGLEIDLEHDVISEVYSSWYAFFGVTRELVKEVPATKLDQQSTRDIVQLSVQILNEGLRPHLNRWQARFRHWYEQEIKGASGKSPQEVQQEFDGYEEPSTDLLGVNQKLIRYRRSMYKLATGVDEN